MNKKKIFELVGYVLMGLTAGIGIISSVVKGKQNEILIQEACDKAVHDELAKMDFYQVNPEE